jgi:hypothetical protein
MPAVVTFMVCRQLADETLCPAHAIVAALYLCLRELMLVPLLNDPVHIPGLMQQTNQAN